MWQYKGMLGNPRYGRVGLIAMPFFAFGEMLAPLVEVLGYGITILGLAYGAIDYVVRPAVPAGGVGVRDAALYLGGRARRGEFPALRAARDIVRLLFYAMLETFGYRQRTVWWRLKAFAGVWKRRQVWGEMVRKGFATPS